MNDGRDLFKEVLKSDWRVTKKLCEMVAYIPEFIADVVIAEADQGMLMKVFGTFHLGYLYQMSNWGTNGMNRDSKIFECEE